MASAPPPTGGLGMPATATGSAPAPAPAPKTPEASSSGAAAAAAAPPPQPPAAEPAAAAAAASSSEEQPAEPQGAATAEEQSLEDAETKEKLRASLHEVMVSSRPRDALSGLGSGLAAMATGIVAGVAGLVVAPIAGAQNDGVAGFAKGLGLGLVGLVVLPVAGIAGGAVQIGRGVYNTPEAIAAKNKGMVWNKSLGIWEAPPGDALQAYDEEAAKRRAAIMGNQPVIDYYAVLELKRDASPEEIKRAYFLLARAHHPDKNPGDDTAKERFQAMGEAYQILSDPRRKAQYDRDGCADAAGTMNASMFFNMVFGSELFEPLVGELCISAMARTADTGGLTSKEMAYQRQTRIMKLLVHLGDMLEPWVAGDQAGFRETSMKLTVQLAGASFGETMLHTLGDVYVREADVHLGNFFEAGLLKLQAKKEEIKAQFQAVKAATQLESYRGEAAEKDVTGMTEQEAEQEMIKRAAVEVKGLTLALAAMWAANRADIQSTVRSAARRLLRDTATATAVRDKRAKGLRELGLMFQAAKGPAHLAGDGAQFMEALKHMQQEGGRGGGDADDEAGPSTGPSPPP